MKPTPAKEWRRVREEGVVLTLSSGKVVRLRPVQLDRMLMRGEIPDMLTPIAASLLWEDETATERSDKDKYTNLVKYTELMDVIISAALIEPKLALSGEPKEDEITLEDIELQDRIEIMQLALQSTEVLKKFRQQQEAGLAAVPSSEDAGATSQPNGGD